MRQSFSAIRRFASSAANAAAFERLAAFADTFDARAEISAAITVPIGTIQLSNIS
jgi:hypothetical protein